MPGVGINKKNHSPCNISLHFKILYIYIAYIYKKNVKKHYNLQIIKNKGIILS